MNVRIFKRPVLEEIESQLQESAYREVLEQRLCRIEADVEWVCKAVIIGIWVIVAGIIFISASIAWRLS